MPRSFPVPHPRSRSSAVVGRVLPCLWIALPPTLGIGFGLLAVEPSETIAGWFAVGFGAGLLSLWLLAIASQGSPGALGIGTISLLFLMSVSDAALATHEGFNPLILSSLLLGGVLAGLTLLATATGDPERDPCPASHRWFRNLRGASILLLSILCFFVAVELLWS